MKTHRRTLSHEELSRLKRDLPWFGQARRDRLADIEEGVAHVHEFEITRIWDINGCRPPCCPFTLLFETTENLFVYIETWDEIEREQNLISKSRLIIESTPITKRLLTCRIEGHTPIKHKEQLRELNEFFEIAGAAEWQTFKEAEMPLDVMTILEAD